MKGIAINSLNIHMKRDHNFTIHYDVFKGSKIKCTEEDVSGTETCLYTKTQMGPDKIVENSKLEKKK